MQRYNISDTSDKVSVATVHRADKAESSHHSHPLLS